jgi:hypothetical protein
VRKQQELAVPSKETAIVTGASQGIGAAVVHAFLDRGYNVVATSRSVSKAGFVPSPNLALVDGDIGQATTAELVAETATDKFGSINHVVNNAGIFAAKPFIDYSVDEFRRFVSTNLEGFIFTTQLAVRQMLSQGTGGGMLPTEGQAAKLIGRVGAELDVEAGRKAAHLAALNGLAVARRHLGSLDKVTRIVRLGVSVATLGDVRDQPKVADAGSELLQDLFGKDRNSCRLVSGVASLPLGTPVALEIIFEVAGQEAA